ncbi:MAG: gamma carbonic anhydrase family protein [Bulleidia sp.]|nr:gamma carbonic anhydrase family protein [Bulleidia sp.]
MTWYVGEGAHVLGDVKLGENASVWFNAVIRGDNIPIRIGSRSNVQDNCTLHGDPDHPVTIGEDVVIGHNAIIHGCTIGNRVLVGMGAIIMNGAVINDDSVVAAGSLVTQNKVFPPGVLIMGSPAKAARPLSEEEKMATLKSVQHYISCAEKELTPVKE